MAIKLPAWPAEIVLARNVSRHGVEYSAFDAADPDEDLNDGEMVAVYRLERMARFRRTVELQPVPANAPRKSSKRLTGGKA